MHVGYQVQYFTQTSQDQNILLYSYGISLPRNENVFRPTRPLIFKEKETETGSKFTFENAFRTGERENSREEKSQSKSQYRPKIPRVQEQKKTVVNRWDKYASSPKTENVMKKNARKIPLADNRPRKKENEEHRQFTPWCPVLSWAVYVDSPARPPIVLWPVFLPFLPPPYPDRRVYYRSSPSPSPCPSPFRCAVTTNGNKNPRAAAFDHGRQRGTMASAQATDAGASFFARKIVSRHRRSRPRWWGKRCAFYGDSATTWARNKLTKNVSQHRSYTFGKYSKWSVWIFFFKRETR